MPRMLDLIRTSAVSANIIQAASRGALMLPPEEIIEVLVYLAIHNKIFSQQAKMTLAGWDEKSSIAVAANPKTPVEVLEYLASTDNLRPPLLPSLLENPSVSAKSLADLARKGSKEVVEAMLASTRVKSSADLRNVLKSNPHARGADVSNLAQPPVASPSPTVAAAATAQPASRGDAPPAGSPETHQTADASTGTVPASEEGFDEEVNTFFKEHAAEIAAEEGKPFTPIGGIYDSSESAEPAAAQTAAPSDTAQGSHSSTPAATVDPKPAAALRPAVIPAKRGSALQKIARLDIKGRIQLAMKGSKEERSLLVRDGTKIVALAVLDSPKIGDSEVEGFASQKNVLEAVLRGIPLKRRFVKNYNVVRNLVFNPRTPLDVSLPLMKNILVNDLRNLSTNKEVSETVRKLATKMFKQKEETTKGSR